MMAGENARTNLTHSTEVTCAGLFGCLRREADAHTMSSGNLSLQRQEPNKNRKYIVIGLGRGLYRHDADAGA